MSDHTQSTSLATFGAGCFWEVEEAFRTLAGANQTTVGYMGGTTVNPAYEEVCTNRTGHVEVLQVEFDPTQIKYAQLLDAFWQCHDPTTLNRQGPDVGSQYRSVIFFHDKDQQAVAEQSKAELAKSGKFTDPVVTTIESAQTFYPAEEYHQQYLLKNKSANCH